MTDDRAPAAAGRIALAASLALVVTVAALVSCARGGVFFQHEEGQLRVGSFVLPRDANAIPATLECEDDPILIYSGVARFVGNCKGFGGPNDRANAVCRQAEAEVTAAAARIQCPERCPLEVIEVFRGWSCGPEGGRFLATCGVQVLVSCRVDA